MSPYEPEEVEAHEHGAREGAAPLYVEHVANLTHGEMQRYRLGDDRVVTLVGGAGNAGAFLRARLAPVSWARLAMTIVALSGTSRKAA